MKNESIISRIISAINGNKVAVRENLFYDATKGLLDFEPDDLINLRAAQTLISGANQTVITAGTTLTPLVIAYAETATPGYTLIRTSDNSFDNNTNVQYDGANFTILGADDGMGHFADNYIFNIKP